MLYVMYAFFFLGEIQKKKKLFICLFVCLIGSLATRHSKKRVGMLSLQKSSQVRSNSNLQSGKKSLSKVFPSKMKLCSMRALKSDRPD